MQDASLPQRRRTVMLRHSTAAGTGGCTPRNQTFDPRLKSVMSSRLRSVWNPPAGQPQHPVFFGAGAAAVEPQPQPVPPVDFTSASRAQQAVAPAGAGPPQHVPGAAWVRAADALVREAS